MTTTHEPYDMPTDIGRDVAVRLLEQTDTWNGHRGLGRLHPHRNRPASLVTVLALLDRADEDTIEVQPCDVAGARALIFETGGGWFGVYVQIERPRPVTWP